MCLRKVFRHPSATLQLRLFSFVTAPTVVPSELPSRPETVLVRRQQNPVLGTTGFESSPFGNGKFIKNRRRPRVMHDNIPNPAEASKNPVLTYFQDKAVRQKDACCVFLLWGSQDSETCTTYAADVQITGLEGEDQIFKILAQEYSARRGFLRYLSFREYDKIEPVTFRIVYHLSRDKFSVFMEPLDFIRYRAKFAAQREEAAATIKSIADFEADPFSDFCARDATGKYEHCRACPLNVLRYGDAVSCPFEQWDMCNDQLDWIDTAKFLSCSFRNYSDASSQRIPRGFRGHSFIHSYRTIAFPRYSFQPQTQHLSLQGLYVKTRMDIGRCICTFAGLIICVTCGGKLFWGDWEILFGVGSLFVAIPMLVMMAITYFDA